MALKDPHSLFCITHYQLRTLCMLSVLGVVLSACGPVDYTVRRENFGPEARRTKPLGQLHFDRGPLQDPYTVELRRDRVHRGYALQAPLYKDDGGLKAHLGVSKTKEYKWFTGLHVSFEF